MMTRFFLVFFLSVISLITEEGKDGGLWIEDDDDDDDVDDNDMKKGVLFIEQCIRNVS